MLLQTSPYSIQIDTPSGVSFIQKLTGRFHIAGQEVSVVEVNSDMFSIKFSDVHILLNTMPLHLNCGVGSSFWISSIALCIILSNDASLVRGRKVLELGSGVGLGGLAAWLFKPHSVLMTDCPEFLSIIYKNIKDNHILSKDIKTLALDWNTCSQPLFDTRDIDGPFETIILSDCVYRDNAKMLKDAVLKNLETNGTAIIINPIRDGLDDFFYSLQEYGSITFDDIPVKYLDNTLTLKYALFVKD